MSFVIGQSTDGIMSTWGQVRCPLIGAYDKFKSRSHNLTVDSGFHPESGLFVRVAFWPGTLIWFNDGTQELQYLGPIVGFFDGGSSIPPQDSYFSIGSYNSSANGPSGYTSLDNTLDKVDIDNGFVGLSVTYTSGTITIDNDALENVPPSFPWFGQNIGPEIITEVTAIQNFTAF